MKRSHRNTANTSALAIETIAISNLQPDSRNARQHSARQIAQIARSIKTFRFNVPILVDRKNRIVAGHGRVQAAKSLGMSEVPTIRLEHLTETQRRAYMLADNKISENATWDERLLGEELKFLSEADLNFDIDVIGFESAEIDLCIENLEEESAKPDDADVVPELAKQAISKPGDLWLLGKHRVLCGDALQSQSYEKLLQGKQAKAVFSDPPYNVKIDGHATGNGVRHREFAMASGEMSKTEFTGFLTTSLKLSAKHSSPGSLHYICMDFRHMGELLSAGDAAYTELKNLCVWVKTNAGLGSHYRSQHELVFVFKSGKAGHRNNIDLGRYGRYRTNVWNYAGATGSKSGRENLELHPTVKPVALVADAILDCTARNELVLDPFLGSGTTVLAAERAGRVCCGMELDPLYVDLAVRRWQKQTGKHAVHAVTGGRFDEVSHA